MFLVDQSKNQLNKLAETSFSEQRISERKNFQEWLAKAPNIMGEELLIIQKEFDGFDNSRKRLDLLALDKKKRLVVIENKLDDSGPDVAWQVLQYAASVANFTTKGIIDIYQDYLDKFCGGGDALQNIRKFLGMEEEESEEMVLNPDNSQRLFLIAKNFRIEVTNTVLWLRKHKVDARCFTIKPYTINNADGKKELLLDIRLIIPPPDIEPFMVRMAEKESETRKAQDARQTCRDYWGEALKALNNEGINLYQSVNPSDAQWLYAVSNLPLCYYSLVLSKKEIRVQFELSRRNMEENKRFFELLFQRKEKIEAKFGGSLQWLRREHAPSSRIQFSNPCHGHDREKWPEYIGWHVEHIEKLEDALKDELTELRKILKTKLND